MKTFIVIALALIPALPIAAQSKKANKQTITASPNAALPSLGDRILSTQADVDLFTANLDNNSKERDVNTIIKDMQQYMDAAGAPKTRADVLLHKNYTPLRSYFLTTTNKTAVATNFLYTETPYTYTVFNNELALYLGAVKCGELYNLAQKTEKAVVRTVLNNCLLPSLKALSEFKDTDIKYIGLSVYYGARDSREGATAPITPYCLTIVASLADVQEYAAGIITAKGLLAKADLYHSDAQSRNVLNKVFIQVDSEEANEVVEVIEWKPEIPLRRATVGPLPDGGTTIMEVK